MNNDANLSSQGEARRQAMRQQLQRQLTEDRYRRRQRHAALLVAGLLLAICSGVYWFRFHSADGTAPVATGSHSSDPSLNSVEVTESDDRQIDLDASPRIDSAVNENSDTETPSSNPKFPRELHLSHVSLQVIDDRELLDLLAAAGDPVFIAWTEDEVLVIPRKNSGL